jgi:hypothetical protein
MTAGDLAARALVAAGDPATGGYYTLQMAQDAIDAAQVLMSFTTLCLETTQAFTVTTPAVDLSSVWTDGIVPLRLRIGGAKIRPANLGMFAAAEPGWYAASGTPSRYAMVGDNLLVLNKTTGAGVSVQLTYARLSAQLTDPSQSLEIPEEFQPALVEFAVPWLRMSEGGQEFTKVLPRLKAFAEAQSQLADNVRKRSIANAFDALPYEMSKAVGK